MQRFRSSRAPASHAAFVGVGGLLMTGCHGAFWGNLAVLAVTVGIFFATLALGRSTSATASAEASRSSGPS